jgi:hypothetical protein
VTAATVCHRRDVFGKVGLCNALRRGQVLLPIEVVGLFEMLTGRLIKHLVKQHSRLTAKQSVQSGEVHAHTVLLGIWMNEGSSVSPVAAPAPQIPQMRSPSRHSHVRWV